MRRISRRRFLRSGLGGIALVALPGGCGSSSGSKGGADADVAIVGAGLAGLIAARDLMAAGADVIVLEARDRVGGRTLNQDIGDGKVVEMVRYFGSRAARPVAYVEKVWLEDPWSRGSYGFFTPGALTVYGPILATPVGRLHWAGSETSLSWPGYMEGAVRSGQRAAQEALMAL